MAVAGLISAVESSVAAGYLTVLLRSPAATYYFLQGSTLLALWVAVGAGSGVDLFRMSERLSNTALRPSWMPPRPFLLLISPPVYRAAAYAVVPAFFAAALAEASEQGPLCLRVALRCLVAVAVTLFLLGDSCRTTSHRDYLMAYTCWALLLLGERGARCVGLGLCVFYIFSSGLSKVLIGGWRQWATDPRTMRAILTTFSKKTPKQGGPILAFAGRLVRGSDACCAFLGGATLAFECVLAPAGAFLLPAAWRFPCVGGGMILLHLGIGALQSGAIGAFFLPNIAAYVFGLGYEAVAFLLRDADPGYGDAFLSPLTPSWCLAVAVFGAPVMSGLLLRRTGLVPEDWPLTPFALFPWSGRQWEFLHANFVEGDLRLAVLSTVRSGGDSPARGTSPASILGMRVISIDHRSDVGLMERSVRPEQGETFVLYDLWSRILGLTTYQDGMLQTALRPAFKAMEARSSKALLRDDPSGNMEAVQAIWREALRFMQESGRVLEVDTGATLWHCYYVRVDKDDRVVKVLLG